MHTRSRSIARALSLFVAVSLSACVASEDDFDDSEASASLTATPRLIGIGAMYQPITRIDPATGATTVLNPYNGSLGTISGVADPIARRLYQVVWMNPSAPHRIMTFNSDTGTLLSSQAISFVFFTLRRTNSGHLVGECGEYSGPYATALRYCRVDPATGGIEVLNALLGDLPSFSQRGIGAYDPSTNRFYLPSHINGADRLIGLDASSGAILSNVTFPANIRSLQVDAQNRLIGSGQSGNNIQMVVINPSTGSQSPLGVLSGVTGNVVLKQALDRVSNRLYQIATDGWGAQSIFTVDAANGTVLDITPLGGSWVRLYAVTRLVNTTTAPSQK